MESTIRSLVGVSERGREGLLKMQKVVLSQSLNIAQYFYLPLTPIRDNRKTILYYLVFLVESFCKNWPRLMFLWKLKIYILTFQSIWHIACVRSEAYFNYKICNI